MQTEKQKISQSILLLKILHVDSNIFGNIKLQKQIFLNELNLTKSNLGGLYYKYFRYNYGPFSADLLADFTGLANKGFLHKTTFNLTNRGQYLVKYVEGCVGNYKENARIFESLENTTKKYRKYNGMQLMKIVYHLEIEPEDMPGEEMQIKDIPMFVDILRPANREFKYKLEFPERILDDIKSELTMEQDAWDHMEETNTNVIKKATRSLMKAVFSDPL